jgi:hypothetical protein
MQVIKGFVTISQYINNVPGINSLIAELSTWNSTFSKEKGEYQDSSIPGYKLVSFKSTDDVDGLSKPISETQVRQILEVVRESVVYATNHIRPYDSIDFLNNLNVSFMDQVMDLRIGSWIDNGSLALPEFISWTNTLPDDVSRIKIWLSDLAFNEQFDDYEIVVIPPIANLDDFFGFYNTAVTLINDKSITEFSDDIQLAKNGYPETYTRIPQFEFINKFNPVQKTLVNWGVLIYGKYGDNPDLIKDAIVKYILANSTHTDVEWTVIFPEIFKKTEFMIFPRWDKVAIHNLTSLSSLYSSILNTQECVDFCIANTPSYTPLHIANNINIVPVDYKAISLLVINGIENNVSKRYFQDVFPDYIPVNSLSLDFSRMSILTRDWMVLLEEALIIAETSTEFSSVPGIFRHTKRNGVLFISMVYDEINYLVAARSNSFYGVI